MKVFIYTLGCKVNQYESQEMSEILEKQGFESAATPDGADVIIVNSCTVTAESVRKTRQAVRHLKKNAPNCIMILTGCASQAEPDELRKLGEVDIFMGNRSDCDIGKALDTYYNTHARVDAFVPHKTGDAFTGTGITRFDGHTRAFLKIQDGCDRFCSYCLIPYARGRSRSKTLADIDRELNALNENGYTEIVFVGINLSDYGKGTETSLPDALMLAEKYDNIKRVRLGSLEPDHITDEMIEKLGKVTKLCPQFHISVQSGSDGVLKAMNRHYTAAEYEHLAEKLRKTFKAATITTDMLAGFPTETESDVEESIRFIKRVGFEKMHIFPYSVRQGTPAAKMPQHTNAVKEERAARLSETAAKIRENFMKAQIGKTVTVLFEAEHDGYSEGYTENYTPVRIYDNKIRTGRIIDVLITDYEVDYCKAREL